tara:strand:+ start:1516 stop:1737 length:222 start_codon:yes stop_codon:yes gene_type:complete
MTGFNISDIVGAPTPNAVLITPSESASILVDARAELFAMDAAGVDHDNVRALADHYAISLVIGMRTWADAVAN